MVKEPEIEVWEKLNQLNAKFAVLVEGSVETAMIFVSLSAVTRPLESAGTGNIIPRHIVNI